MNRYYTIAILIAVALAAGVAADVPTFINYQGRLTDDVGDPVADGDYELRFSIYNAAVEGELLWSEVQELKVVDGLFAVLLGSRKPIVDNVFERSTCYLSLTVGGDPEILPRTMLVTVPWAYRVSTVDGASGGTITSKLSIGQGHSNSGSYGFVSGYINRVLGNYATIGGGTKNRVDGDYSSIPGGYADTIDATADYSYLFGIGSKLTQDSTFMVDMPHVRFGHEASGYEIPVSDGTIDQVMTTDGDGQLSWTTVAGISGSGWVDAGTTIELETSSDSVGIGISTPTEKLHVLGNILVTGKATIGWTNSSTGLSSFVAGVDDTITGEYNTISGGQGNRVGGWHSSVAGGHQNYIDGSHSSIGGGFFNRVLDTAATISGGEYNTTSGRWATVGGGRGNQASDTSATVGGGWYNTASENVAFVGGGWGNTASGYSAFVGGGVYNEASDWYSYIGGGLEDTASGWCASVGGGRQNTASGNVSTVPGGYGCTASGNGSFAAGNLALAVNDGSFVWGDFGSQTISSTADNQFMVRASGGTVFYSNSALTSGVTLAAGGSSWSTVSDSTHKRNIREVDYKKVLEKVADLPISQWSYESQDENIEHIGPMAQDFYQLFGLGEDDKHINTLDPDGIALAAIKALHLENQQLKEQLSTMEERLAKLEKQ